MSKKKKNVRNSFVIIAITQCKGGVMKTKKSRKKKTIDYVREYEEALDEQTKDN